MRLFIALKIPDDIVDYMAGIRRELLKNRADVKWVEPNNYHFTLKFLGEVKPEQIPSIEQALSLAAESCAGFNIFVHKLGFFPNSRRPRVIWAGVNGETESIIFLGERIDNCLVSCNFAPDNRRNLHLTLGRIRSERNLEALIKQTEQLSSGICTASFFVERFYLMESKLSSSGPAYIEKKVFYCNKRII